jgi:hypothetical protein
MSTQLTKKERARAGEKKESARRKVARAAAEAARLAKRLTGLTKHLASRGHHSGKPYAALADDTAAGPYILKLLDRHRADFAQVGFLAEDRGRVASAHSAMAEAGKAKPPRTGFSPGLSKAQEALVLRGIAKLEARLKSIGRAIDGLKVDEREKVLAPFTTADALRETAPGPVVHALDVFVNEARAQADFLLEECCVTAAMVDELARLREEIAPLVGSKAARRAEERAAIADRVGKQLAFEAALRKYAAACYGVFEDDPKKLVAALELIPRRKRDRRRAAKRTPAGPVPAVPPH